MGEEKARGAGKEKKGGTRGDLSTPGEKEKSGVRARSSGESVLTLINAYTKF